MKKGFIVIAIILLAVSGFSQSGIPEVPNPKRLVNDFAGVFSAQQVQALEESLVAFSDTTSNQIVVVTMSDLGQLTPFDMAYGIGRKWGVGQKEFDNGIVVLVKPKAGNSRGQIFIATGYGLEGAIPDATTKMIIENDIIPYFKQGEMFKGVVMGVNSLKALAAGEINSDEYAAKKRENVPIFPVFMILFVVIIAIISKAKRAKTYSVGHDVSFWTALWLLNQSSGHGGHYNNFTSGSGGFGGGGGFGGFGGGGFGGGGAGGSW